METLMEFFQSLAADMSHVRLTLCLLSPFCEIMLHASTSCNDPRSPRDDIQPLQIRHAPLHATTGPIVFHRHLSSDDSLSGRGRETLRLSLFSQ